MATATTHDGSEVYFEAHGQGPAVMLFNAHPCPPEHPAQAQLIAFRDAVLDALTDRYRVLLPAYPGTPRNGTLTPAAVTRDLLAIADAADVGPFAFWGHSWGAVIGLQLAVASDRVSALALSGFPPLDGPYEAMLRSVRALAGIDGAGRTIALPDTARAEYRQFVTYYEGLVGFDDRAAHQYLTMPKLYFVGRDDQLPLGGEVVARFGDTALDQRDELERRGWHVEIVPDRDHTTLIDTDAILPVLAPFLDDTLPAGVEEL